MIAHLFHIMVVAGGAATAAACPFCDVVTRPLAERRDAAAVVAVGEAAGAAETQAGVVRQPFLVRSLLRGDAVAVDDTVAARVAGPILGTAVLFDEADGRFEGVAADETLLGYLAAAQATEAAGRLEWFRRDPGRQRRQRHPEQHHGNSHVLWRWRRRRPGQRH
jgi:hypothetical protein